MHEARRSAFHWWREFHSITRPSGYRPDGVAGQSVVHMRCIGQPPDQSITSLEWGRRGDHLETWNVGVDHLQVLRVGGAVPELAHDCFGTVSMRDRQASAGGERDLVTDDGVTAEQRLLSRQGTPVLAEGRLRLRLRERRQSLSRRRATTAPPERIFPGRVS
jgi:hypothetical protein